MTVCEDERRQWRTEQSVARSRVYEQSDVRLAAANRGVRCRRNEATVAMYRLTTSLTHESRPSTELGLTVLNVFKKKIVLKEF
jgi:hypothetical protein